MKITKAISLFTLAALMILTCPQKISALEQNHSITITAVVLPMRFIYVDNSQTIQKIIGNTTADIQPRVVMQIDPTREIPMTPNINSQYAYIKSHYDILKIGEDYNKETITEPSVRKPKIKELFANWLGMIPRPRMTIFKF